MSKDNPPPYHHLFEPEDGVSSDDFAPEPIAAIYVTRLESTGKIRVPRRFLPDELRDLDAVFLRFGGGTYELEARRADGSIYAKRLRTLPGPPRPLIDPASMPDAPAPTASAAPTGDASGPLGALSGLKIDPMVLLMLHMSDRQAQAQTSMMQAVVAAIAGRPVPPAPPQSSPAEMLAAMATAMGALKPAPPPPAPPLEGVLALHKMIREEATAQNTAAVDLADRRSPQPAEASAGEQLKSIVEAAVPILSLLPTAPPKPPGT